jgi:hypothetical protein
MLQPLWRCVVLLCHDVHPVAPRATSIYIAGTMHSCKLPETAFYSLKR